MQTSALTPAESTATEAGQRLIALPTLYEGERYAGIVLDAEGAPSYHLIILPGDVELPWDDAMAWAKTQGGELPTRAEQHLLFCNAKSAFQPTWYWSGEQYAGDASNAWLQAFDDGYQYGYGKGYQGRVRAVRRFLID